MKTFNENARLAHFDAWGGATNTKADIISTGKDEEFEQLIEELYPDGLSETQLNDILWFETDWIYERLGMETE